MNNVYPISEQEELLCSESHESNTLSRFLAGNWALCFYDDYASLKRDSAEAYYELWRTILCVWDPHCGHGIRIFIIIRKMFQFVPTRHRVRTSERSISSTIYLTMEEIKLDILDEPSTSKAPTASTSRTAGPKDTAERDYFAIDVKPKVRPFPERRIQRNGLFENDYDEAPLPRWVAYTACTIYVIMLSGVIFLSTFRIFM